MQMIVLIKQIPAPGVVPNQHGMVNPYDELALEESLQIRKRHGGTVTAISLGGPHCVKAVETALAMGADRGLFITDDRSEPLEGLELAHCLARLIRPMPFDLILAGHRSVDTENHTVGPALAELLNIAYVSMVIEQRIENGRIRCRRRLEKEYQTLQAPLPALITAESGLNTPGYVSLPGIRRARKKPLKRLRLKEIWPPPSFLGTPVLQRCGTTSAVQSRVQHVLDRGAPREKAAALVQWLQTQSTEV